METMVVLSQPRSLDFSNSRISVGKSLEVSVEGIRERAARLVNYANAMGPPSSTSVGTLLSYAPSSSSSCYRVSRKGTKSSSISGYPLYRPATGHSMAKVSSFKSPCIFCTFSVLRPKQQQLLGLQKSCVRFAGVFPRQRIKEFGVYSKFKTEFKRIQRPMDGGNVLESQEELPQLAISLPLGLASFEALFMVGWVLSLRGVFPGREFFSASDLILCSVMFANCIVGWYTFEHSWTLVGMLPRDRRRGQVKAVKPRIWDLGSSLLLSFIPFANLFLWLRFASQQSHLSARARAGIVANAWVYGGPPLFAILLILNGGFLAFLQIGLVSQFALLLGAVHRPFEMARIKNEKVLMEVTRASNIGGDKAKGKKEYVISPEEKEMMDRKKELEEFDSLLAQRPSRATAILPGEPREWSVGDTMQWLAQQDLARYATTFADNNVDGALLLELTDTDLRNALGIQSLGDRRKLEMSIKQLRVSVKESGVK